MKNICPCINRHLICSVFKKRLYVSSESSVFCFYLCCDGMDNTEYFIVPPNIIM